MTRRPARLPRALGASAVVFLLPLAACAGTDEAAGSAPSGSSAPSGASATQDAPEAAPEESAPAAEGQRIEVVVAGDQVSGDTGRVPVAVGTQVTLVVTSDVADEVHVHGYDLTADLLAGTPAEISFPATIPGVFEVELHEAGTALLALQVS